MFRRACPGAVRGFWDHIRDGMSAADAGVAVGVSVQTGRKWFAQAGGVRPKFPDEGRPRKWRPLSLDERVEVEVGVKTQESIRDIARRLDRHPSTIMREIDRNAFCYGRYQESTDSGRRRRAAGTPSRGIAPPARRRAPSSKRAARSLASWRSTRRLHDEVQTRLKDKHSPEQIARRLPVDFPDDAEMRVSHETIYQSIYV